ncbi:hypothetical protein DJ031_03670 [bacterium endosymbiont of Escarpia laminata]|nr:MAG: hypothetical protein DJ031_03670 [bacterium endosymbiont of Escarpia laminata]
MPNSLLAHIASNFISEYENVANSSIAYLLNEYPASQEALKSILGVDNVPTYYVTEMSTDSNGRPDVTGLDGNGCKSVIIEGKFWANLTHNQPNNYLKEITDEGKILFLAPDKRLNSLNIEIDKRTGSSEKVVISSWIEFLSLIEKENNKNHNHQLSSDLLQINELCRKMDTEGMPPLSASDLDPMNGRVASNFSDVIDECNPILREWEYSDFKGTKTTSAKYGHGFYFRGYNFGCSLYFDSRKWFVINNHTPIWLYIGSNDWKKSETISHYLNDYDSFNSFDSDFGIILHEGMDKNQIVDHIVNEVKKVLEYLNRKITNG